MLESAPGAAANQATWTFLANLVYFCCLEGFWGASAGKGLLGIRVASFNAAVPSFVRVILRTVIFYIPNLLMALLASTGLLGGDTLSNIVRSLLPLALLVSLFSFARRSNGWAGLHELATGTRVVLRRVGESRRLTSSDLEPAAEALPIRPTGRKYGPFTAISDPQPTGDGQLLIAFDPILRRQVWIHSIPPGSSPINKVRRDVGRGGRLFWLTGRRSPEENWDAFEAPAGEPLLSPRFVSKTWPTRKLWLLELANELIASSRDNTLPALKVVHESRY